MNLFLKIQLVESMESIQVTSIRRLYSRGGSFSLYSEMPSEIFMFSFFIRQRVIALTPALREILQIKAEEKTRPIEFNPSAFLDSRLTRKLRVNGAFAFCNCFPGSFVFIFYFMIRSRAIFMAYSNFTHIELLDFPCNVI